jgi:hypothetical protein
VDGNVAVGPADLIRKIDAIERAVSYNERGPS